MTTVEVIGSFADDAVYWWAPGDDEKAPRISARGTEIADALADDLGADAYVAIAVEDGANRLAEGTVAGGAGSFLASLQLDRDGRILRALSFRCPAIEPSPSWAAPDEPFGHDARAILDRYFAELDAARIEAAAECFSPDTLYSHPPYFPGAPRAEFRGREELLDGFVKRGPRSNHHEIAVAIQRGRDCIVEGYSHHPGGDSGQFVSSLTLDDDGLIRRYASVVFAPAVGRV